jgi:hypothetical protein
MMKNSKCNSPIAMFYVQAFRVARRAPFAENRNHLLVSNEGKENKKRNKKEGEKTI